MILVPLPLPFNFVQALLGVNNLSANFWGFFVFFCFVFLILILQMGIKGLINESNNVK